MSPIDNHLRFSDGLTTPVRSAAAVTPSDTVDLPYTTKALYIGASGDVTVNMLDTGTITYTGLKAGTTYPLRVTRVLATGTTATAIVALW